MWRPKEGWAKPKIINNPLHCLAPQECAKSFYEAGADAMYEPAYEKGKKDGKKELLETLRKTGGHVDAWVEPARQKGVWVFIPDDPVEPPARPQEPHAFDEG